MSSVNFEDSVGYFCGNIFNTVKYGLLELGQGKKKKKMEFLQLGEGIWLP